MHACSQVYIINKVYAVLAKIPEGRFPAISCADVTRFLRRLRYTGAGDQTTQHSGHGLPLPWVLLPDQA